MKLFIFIVLLCGFSKAQNSDQAETGKLYIEPAFVSLRSTHSDFFNGNSLLIGGNISERFSLGAGMEYTQNKFHNDNDWLLYNLKFNSLILREQFLLLSKQKIKISSDLREGFSFIKYIKEEPLKRPNYRYPVKENGLYLYSGLDTKFRIVKNISVVGDFGFKGLHMSTNVLEVNPHGINFMTGLQINI